MIVRHYKGSYYEVCGNVLHTETNEWLTIYNDAEGNMFARPRKMFEGYTEEGEKRFVAVTPDDIPDANLVLAFMQLNIAANEYPTCEEMKWIVQEWNKLTSKNDK